MKARVKMVPTYEVEINGRVFRNFQLVETWEGMAKLENDDGLIIVDSLESYSAPEYIVGQLSGNTVAKEVDVIKATHTFIHLAEENTVDKESNR